ncbi:MAG TPA: S53 family peptidase [Candidatus Baltobacteraceae bacterium]|nr:S53 family peptidase [Candidatus Baltobacteraceae bacterium]
MKRLAVLGLAVGLATASCAGHGGSSAVPAMPQSNNGGTIKPAATAAAPAGWASTNTAAIPIANATDLGAAPATSSVTVRVALGLHNASQLQQVIASGTVLDDAAFSSTYGPTPSEVSQVTSYLQSKGFSNVTVEPDNVLVSATGTIAQAQNAFDTSIHSFSGGGVNFIANVAPAYVPSALGGIVVSVLGLNNLQAFKSNPQPTNCEVKGVATPPQACLRWYNPATFQIAYDAASMKPASGTPVAIMAEGDTSGAIADFRTNEQKDNMPQIPVNVIQVGLNSGDTAGNGEWTLDMTYSQGMAQSLKAIYIYQTTSLTDSDIALEYSKWVTQHYTNIGNSSFGGCEFFPFLDGSMVAMDEMLVEGAAKGMTMFVSSGDNGGYCNNFVDTNGVPGGAPFVEYPASSPYVAAVGGTELYSNADGSYKGEDVWPAGGGGLSQFEYSPVWEQKAQPVSANALSMRGVPDVAINAGEGPIGNAIIYNNEQAVNGGSCSNGCITGGTSLASPLSAGTWARVQYAHGNKLGFAPVWFYKNFVSHAAGSVNAGPPAWQPDGGFHDILTGSNALYTSLPGYDYTTGLGSFDASLLNSQI